jgi:hypothetical protein
MNNEPVAWNYNDPHNAPNTITFNNLESTWVMQITADRKIIVNEDVGVSEAAQAVLDALQPLLLKPHPAKTLTDEEIWEVINRTAWVGTEEEIRFKIAEAILRKAQEK